MLSCQQSSLLSSLLRLMHPTGVDTQKGGREKRETGTDESKIRAAKDEQEK